MGTGQYYPTLNNRGLALKILRSYLVTTVLCTKTWSKQTPLCTKGNLQFLPLPDLGFLYIFILTSLLIKPHWNYSIWIRKQTQAERSAGKSNDVELYPTYTGSNKLNCFKVIRTETNDLELGQSTIGATIGTRGKSSFPGTLSFSENEVTRATKGRNVH